MFRDFQWNGNCSSTTSQSCRLVFFFNVSFLSFFFFFFFWFREIRKNATETRGVAKVGRRISHDLRAGDFRLAETAQCRRFVSSAPAKISGQSKLHKKKRRQKKRNNSSRPLEHARWVEPTALPLFAFFFFKSAREGAQCANKKKTKKVAGGPTGGRSSPFSQRLLAEWRKFGAGPAFLMVKYERRRSFNWFFFFGGGGGVYRPPIWFGSANPQNGSEFLFFFLRIFRPSTRGRRCT